MYFAGLWRNPLPNPVYARITQRFSSNELKVFIQQVESQEFMGRDDVWVPSIGSARDFQTTVGALDFCFARHLTDVQIRACFDCGDQDIVWGVNNIAQ